MMLYTEITSCRSCGSQSLEEMLNLGNLCISDFLNPGCAEDRAPLVLLECKDCSLIQLQHAVNRDRLYRSYFYRSGTNESMVRALREIVNDAVTRISLPASKDIAVVDIGCNDGTLLNMYPGHWELLGFEPSQIAHEAARNKDIAVSRDFFPTKKPWYNYITKQPHIITSIAMFYDVNDPNEFVAAIKDWLHPDGIWVLQLPELEQMFHTNGFDAICHEHLTYWPLHALISLLSCHGLEITHCSHNSVNGGSIKLIIQHAKRVYKLCKTKWFSHHQMIVLKHNIEKLSRETLALIDKINASGKLVLGYGASTKGNTLIQYYGIGPKMIPAIADRNSDKWGRVTAGSHIPIISEEEMRSRNPDYLFVLPWHFIDSFKQRESEFMHRGGQFIVPLPELNIIGHDHADILTAHT